VETLLEGAHYLAFDVVLADQLYVLFDLVALVETDAGVVERVEFDGDSGEGGFVWSDNFQHFLLVQNDDLGEVAAWGDGYFLRERLKESW
jgi:hypothetical protein